MSATHRSTHVVEHQQVVDSREQLQFELRQQVLGHSAGEVVAGVDADCAVADGVQPAGNQPVKHTPSSLLRVIPLQGCL